MANTRSGNVFYADATGELTTDSNIKLVGVFLASASTTDVAELTESASGPTKLYLKCSDQNDTHFFDLSGCPIVFARGIYVKTLSSNVKLTLVTSTGGGVA